MCWFHRGVVQEKISSISKLAAQKDCLLKQSDVPLQAGTVHLFPLAVKVASEFRCQIFPRGWEIYRTSRWRPALYFSTPIPSSVYRSVTQSRKKSVWGNHTNVKSQITVLQRTKTLDSSRSKVKKRNPVKFLSLLTPLIASSVCFLSFLTRPASLVSLRIEGNILLLQDGNLHKGDFYSCFSPASLSVLLPLDGICAPLPHGSPTLHGDYTILLWRGSEPVCLAEPHIVQVKN